MNKEHVDGDVRRWRFGTKDGGHDGPLGLHPDPEGSWVFADDYALLSDAYAMLENDIIGLKVKHETALSTVQELHREAVRDKEQVTRELEECKQEKLEIAMSKSVTFVTPPMEPHEAVTHLQKMLEQQRQDYARLERAHREVYATARSDALREAKEAIVRELGLADMGAGAIAAMACVDRGIRSVGGGA